MVGISSVSISNLRGIKSCRLDEMADVNVLVGSNGSGKSTILEAVYLASAWAQNNDPIRGKHKLDYTIERRTGRKSWMEAKEYLWYRMETQNPIKITLTFTTGTKYALKIIEQEKEVWLELPRKVRAELAEYDHFSAATKTLLNLKTLRKTSGQHVLSEYVEAPETRFLGGAVLIDAELVTNPSHIEREVWPKALHKRLDKQVVEVLRQGYEPTAEGLTYMPYPEGLAVQLKDTTVRIDDLGDGARIAVITGLALSTVKDTAVMIEDPESHQHPKGLAVIMDFALKMAKTNNLQLLITTHSIELVKILRKLSDKHSLKYKVYHVQRDHQGHVDTRTLTPEDSELLEGLGERDIVAINGTMLGGQT